MDRMSTAIFPRCLALHAFAATLAAAWLLVGAVLPAPAAAAERIYAIQLNLSGTPPDPGALPALPALADHELYTVVYDKLSSPRYALRLGFFPSATAADRVRDSLLKAFPDAWVLRVPAAERQAAATSRVRLPAPAPVPTPAPAPKRAAPRASSAAAPAPEVFAVQLSLSGQPADRGALPSRPELAANTLYENSYQKDGATWYQLRLGFFPTAAAAAEVAQALDPSFPGAWVLRVPAAERTAALASPIRPAAARANAAKAARPVPVSAPPAASDERLGRMMELARQAVAKRDYPQAIRLYTAVLDAPPSEFSQDAREFLGLARERNGQLAHAKAEYDTYLAQYPEGPGADRVRQRLAGLLTATAKDPEKLRSAKADPAKPLWDAHGGLSQYYRRDTTTDATGDTVVQQSSLDTDVDLSLRRRGPKWDLRSRFTGGYRNDFLTNGPGNESRITSAYVDATNLDNRVSTRVGRQSRTTGGVLGRFDGLLVTSPLTRRTRLDWVAGFPVERSVTHGIATDRWFYGLAYNAGTFAEAWDLQAFIIDQRADGMADRRAVGGELRYFRDTRSLLTLVDYDILFAELNKVLVLGNWTLADESNLNLVVDYGLSPVLTSTNALQGQTAPSLSALRDTYTESQVRDLARDRTPTTRSVTLGASHPLRDDLTISADATVSSTSSTPASGGVAATPATGNEYAYSAQLIGQGILFAADTTIFGVRYSDGQTSDLISLSVDNRYPKGKWRLNPRLRVDYRDNASDNSTQWSVLPTFRVNWLASRYLRFETEAGGEWSTHKLTANTENTSGYFVTVGYRLDF
jgi:tetratricopeptide (TPR) repeat protein